MRRVGPPHPFRRLYVHFGLDFSITHACRKLTKELRLPTMLREYDKVARQCAVEQVDCRSGQRTDRGSRREETAPLPEADRQLRTAHR